MRNRRAIFFLLLSMVSGLAAVIAYYGSVRDAQKPVAELQIETIAVVMAKETLSAGVAIQATQLQVHEWPSVYAPLGGIQVIEDVVHRIPRRGINIGEPILEQLLLEEGRQSGLTALIEANHRAMSVKAGAVVGVGGFIQPGSRVDVLAQLKDTDRDKGRLPYSRTILQNVKVLAIDEKFERIDDGEHSLASVVTLEVDPIEAQLLSYAAAEGSLHLALRNEIDEELVKLKNVGPKDFIDDLPKPKRKKVARAPRRKSIESIRGTEISREYL